MNSLKTKNQKTQILKISVAIILSTIGCRSVDVIPSLGVDELEGEDISFLQGAESRSSVLPKKCRRFDNGKIDGTKTLVLVNKGEFTPPNSTTFQNQLPSGFEPTDLSKLDKKYMAPGFPRARMRAEAKEHFIEMADAARAEGHYFYVRTAYRSFTHQCSIFTKRVKRRGEANALRSSAEPGRSQHQLGTTFDLYVKGFGMTYAIGNTPEIKWVLKNGYKYGYALSYPRPTKEQRQGRDRSFNPYTGYIYEPWHYRYIGIENATQMHEQGLILEEYLRNKQKQDYASVN